MTHRRTNHLLEWGAAAPAEWLWPPAGRPRPVGWTFHTPTAARPDVFVKCALFWRAWLGGPHHPWAVHTRRWTTLGATGAAPTRWAETAACTGLGVDTATTGLIDLVRPRQFDYSRWGLTLRGHTRAPHRWGAYLVGCTTLAG